MSSLRHLRRGQQAASLKRPLNLVTNGGRVSKLSITICEFLLQFGDSTINNSASVQSGRCGLLGSIRARSRGRKGCPSLSPRICCRGSFNNLFAGSSVGVVHSPPGRNRLVEILLERERHTHQEKLPCPFRTWLGVQVDTVRVSLGCR